MWKREEEKQYGSLRNDTEQERGMRGRVTKMSGHKWGEGKTDIRRNERIRPTDECVREGRRQEGKNQIGDKDRLR